jgi:hypothetical protein
VKMSPKAAEGSGAAETGVGGVSWAWV